MKMTWTELILLSALNLPRYIVVELPHIIYHFLAERYKKHARAIRARIPLSPAAERARRSRENLNRNHGFMKLPGELRNRIYSMCMINEAVLDPVWGAIYELKNEGESEVRIERSSIYPGFASQLYPTSRLESSKANWTRMSNMSQVCRVWRQEALLHFYGNNIFKLTVGKHLHERSRKGSKYAIWNTWRSQWNKKFPGPAGPFAFRLHYPPWLHARPREAFAVLRLMLHDYRHCPHFSPPPVNWAQNLRGDCMILVDFSGQDISLRAVKGTHLRTSFQLWECDVCWGEFVERLGRVGRNEDMRKLFTEFREERNSGAAIKVVDGVRRILGIEYERE